MFAQLLGKPGWAAWNKVPYTKEKRANRWHLPKSGIPVGYTCLYSDLNLCWEAEKKKNLILRQNSFHYFIMKWNYYISKGKLFQQSNVNWSAGTDKDNLVIILKITWIANIAGELICQALLEVFSMKRSFNYCNSIKWMLPLSLLCRWVNQGTERLSTWARSHRRRVAEPEWVPGWSDSKRGC